MHACSPGVVSRTAEVEPGYWIVWEAGGVEPSPALLHFLHLAPCMHLALRVVRRGLFCGESQLNTLPLNQSRYCTATCEHHICFFLYFHCNGRTCRPMMGQVAIFNTSWHTALPPLGLVCCLFAFVVLLLNRRCPQRLVSLCDPRPICAPVS
jgi:hypothetical protein